MQAHGVLAHFQAAGGHATGVGRFAWCVADAGPDEQVHRFQGRRHIGAFGHADAAVLQQRASILSVQFVLRRAGQSDIAGQAPRTLPGEELQTIVLSHLAQAATTHVLQVHQVQPLLIAQAALGIESAIGVGQRDHPSAQIHDLLRGVLGDVAGTGNRHALAFEALVDTLEHLLGEVHAAIASGFRADQAATVAQALAGQHRGELIGQTLVLAEQVTDLAPTDADVTSRHIQVGTDMAIQLGHERLAEAHHFALALALGVEVRAALAAAHGQRGQRVFEHLLEGEELEHAQVDRGVETQTALVRTDDAAHLDTVAAVNLHLATVVDPRHAKQDGPFRLDHTLENAGLAIARTGFEEGP